MSLTGVPSIEWTRGLGPFEFKGLWAKDSRT